jgi:hypothetical protein
MRELHRVSLCPWRTGAITAAPLVLLRTEYAGDQAVTGSGSLTCSSRHGARRRAPRAGLLDTHGRPVRAPTDDAPRVRGRDGSDRAPAVARRAESAAARAPRHHNEIIKASRPSPHDRYGRSRLAADRADSRRPARGALRSSGPRHTTILDRIPAQDTGCRRRRRRSLRQRIRYKILDPSPGILGKDRASLVDTMRSFTATGW